MEMNVMKEEIYTHKTQKQEAQHAVRGRQEAEMGEGRERPESLLRFWGEGRGRVSSGQEGLNSFPRALL